MSLLKDARIEQGLSLELVHEATKIPMDALRAIEEGYTVKILSPFYYRAFVKSYAKFLGLDVKKVFGVYNLPSSTTPRVQTKKPAKVQPPGPNYAVDGLKDFIAYWSKPSRRKLLLKYLGIIVALFLAWKAVGAVGDWFKNRPKASSAASKEPSKAVTSVQRITKRVDVPKGSAATEKMPAAQEVSMPKKNERNVKLTVRANRDSWLIVKTDGNVVFQMTLKKGSAETWRANKDIEISGKNIHQLEFEVNGKHLGTLGRAERRAKRIVITKDGLAVKK